MKSKALSEADISTFFPMDGAFEEFWEARHVRNDLPAYAVMASKRALKFDKPDREFAHRWL
jgi:hypothetical protein